MKRKQHSLLSESETRELIAAAQQGDEEAAGKIVYHNARVIMSIISKMKKSPQETEDFFQLGCLGLFQSILKFDLCSKAKFMTYAYPRIVGEIKTSLRDMQGMFRVQRGVNAAATKIKVEKLEDRTLEELQELLKLKDTASVEEALYVASIKMQTFDSPIKYTGTMKVTLVDLLHTEEVENDWLSRIYINSLISKLQPREQELITLRFIEDKSQREAGAILRLSQAQVCRIEYAAIEKLRNLHNEAQRELELV